MNIGEKNELLIKLKLIELRDQGDSINLNGTQTPISSVGFNSDEYRSLPSSTNIRALRDDVEELKRICSVVGTLKSGSLSKADVHINGIGFSLKSLETANPAIINHTPRDGFIKVCNRISHNISNLDPNVIDYLNKRSRGILNEDVPNNQATSPFYDSIDNWKPVIDYFLFDGTARCDSKHKADYILDFTDPLNTQSWSILSRANATRHMWHKLVFSIRSKGMHFKYPKINEPRKSQIDHWTRTFDNRYKGALHVRYDHNL